MECLPPTADSIKQCSGSEIRDFYKGKCVFVTGGIGFIGKVLIDSIIRKCSDVEAVYVLIRPKKGRTAQERLLETLKQQIFHGLSDKQISKLHSLDGNVEAPGLGLSMEDSLLLKAKAQIVIHCAANVRFDEKIRISLTTNVKGTLNLLELCREMNKVESIIYVSTAFSNSQRDDIDEKFYKPPLDIETALTLTNYQDDYVLRMLEPLLLGKWPNTYAFSKGITENLIKLKSKGLPIGIYRPSIVLGTSYMHHLPGYIDNMFGPTSLFIGIGLGAVRVLNMSYGIPAILVPADMCANGIIAASWHVANYSYEEPIIFNFVTDDKNKVTWSDMAEQAMDYLKKFPVDIQIWYPEFAFVSNPMLFFYYKHLLHVVPGVLVDFLLYLRGEQPKLMKVYRKLEVLMAFLVRYYQTYWSFGQRNIKSLFSHMSTEEKQIFNFDMSSFDWARNIQPMADGIKTHLVNKSVVPTKLAIKRLKIFKTLHYTIKFAYYAFLFYLVTLFLSYVIRR